MTCPYPWSDEVQHFLSSALIEHAPTGPHTETHLSAAITETVTRPGKLIRARLAYATATSHGVDERTAGALAAAVEYFHAASLLLDDLPCMDNAATRRGHPCAHRQHGEATAILAALAFINRAYALVGLALADRPGSVRTQAQAFLDATLGTSGLVDGQARDLRFGSSDRSLREVSRIALNKTGTMLWLGLLFPALLTNPSQSEWRRLNALCTYWSLAFQALDDLQDLLATSVNAGKTTGRDRALVRPNLALSLGVPAARRRILRLLTQADRVLQQLVRDEPVWSFLDAFQHAFTDTASALEGGARTAAA